MIVYGYYSPVNDKILLYLTRVTILYHEINKNDPVYYTGSFKYANWLNSKPTHGVIT